MNEIAEKMSEEEKNAFIEESNNVFIMNNLIVNSVGGQNKVLYNLLYKATTVVAIVAGVVLAYKLYKWPAKEFCVYRGLIKIKNIILSTSNFIYRGLRMFWQPFDRILLN